MSGPKVKYGKRRFKYAFQESLFGLDGRDRRDALKEKYLELGFEARFWTTHEQAVIGGEEYDCRVWHLSIHDPLPGT